ncbi:MAG TPA: fused MFS/spermidine synthase [Chloroflexota bacterium]|nr:fused MFS/spermidine synthase [Chloroflexota bacterium]
MLFLIQPLFARLLLPALGSSPVVWNTALVFYQAGLLLGYAYAHLTVAWLGVRRQAVLHLGVLALAALSLPLALRHGPAALSLDFPVPWLVQALLLSAGAPYVAVAATSPLMQRWYLATGLPRSSDPYFLYAASNAGSIAALLGYPLLVEPLLGLADQRRLWTAGFALLFGLVLVCALAVWRAPAPAVRGAPGPADAEAAPGAAVGARWVLLSALPSALLVSVTAHISADVAAIPLLWVVPLVVYLLTFVIAFSGRAPLFGRVSARVLPFVLVALAVTLGARAVEPVLLLLLLHLEALFVVAMLCHGRLAQTRPGASRLTLFYFWVSLGGVAGGAFAALLAPLLFPVVVEYPLALVLAVLVAYRPLPGARPASPNAPRLDVALPLLLAALAAGLFIRGKDAALTGNALGTALLFGPPAVICLTFRGRPLRFALGVGALLLTAALFYGSPATTLLEARSYFGVHRVRQVTLDPGNSVNVLIHGNTVHGAQRQEAGLREEPQAYYVRSGPIGQVFGALRLAEPDRPVGVVGLGAGGLACYGGPGQRWRFFELDPLVWRIAADARYFTFLRDCPPQSDVILGDGRLTLAGEPDASFGTIIFDAYSSDAIPIHLLTREALRLYLQKLAPGGVLVFHISSRHLDLAPVLGSLAADAGLACHVRTDNVAPDGGASAGNGTPSRWAVMARSAADLGPLLDDPRWEPAPAPGGGALWTDDYASIVGVFR